MKILHVFITVKRENICLARRSLYSEIVLNLLDWKATERNFLDPFLCTPAAVEERSQTIGDKMLIALSLRDLFSEKKIK